MVEGIEELAAEIGVDPLGYTESALHGEIQIDQAAAHHEIPNAVYGIAQHFIGLSEGLFGAGLFNQLEQQGLEDPGDRIQLLTVE